MGALSKLTAHAALMATLVAVASRAVPPWRFNLLCAAVASAYSATLLKAYVVGPVIGALTNRLAAMPLVASVLSLGVIAARPGGGLAHACAVLLPDALFLNDWDDKGDPSAENDMKVLRSEGLLTVDEADWKLFKLLVSRRRSPPHKRKPYVTSGF